MTGLTGGLVAFAALLELAAGAQSQRFTIAIVRLDGRLVPFASYDNTHWEKPWPEPGEALLAKLTIDDVPSVWRRRGERVPEIWHVWRTGHTTPIDARVTAEHGLAGGEEEASGRVGGRRTGWGGRGFVESPRQRN